MEGRSRTHPEIDEHKAFQMLNSFFFFKLSAIQVNIFFLLVQELPSVSLNFTPKVLHFCLFSLSYKITGFEHVFASWLFPVSLAGLALVQLACCLLMLDLHPSNVLSRA